MFLQPTQVTILATSKCTARCGHCSMNSGPERRERVSFEAIRRTIDDLADLGALHTVIFAGGEPTLLGETLLDAIAYADGLNLNTRIVTNAYWAVTREMALRKLNELRDAGLQELNISADDYHLPYIPFENVERAWMASKRMGFGAVVIANCYGPYSTVTPEFIMSRLGERLQQRFDDDGRECGVGRADDDGTVYMLSNSFTQMLGRAHAEMRRSEVWFPADQAKLEGGCPWAARSPALSPRNHLVACCGMEAEGNPILDFGDANAMTPRELACKADDSVLVNAIALLGPAFLMRFIAERAADVPFRERYASVCEVCEDVVTQPAARAILKAHMAELSVHVLRARKAAEGQKSTAAARQSARSVDPQTHDPPSASSPSPFPSAQKRRD